MALLSDLAVLVGSLAEYSIEDLIKLITNTLLLDKPSTADISKVWEESTFLVKGTTENICKKVMTGGKFEALGNSQYKKL